jgi:hypothetical protein
VMKAAQVTTAERSFTAATRSLQKVHELNGHKRHLQQRPLKFCTCQFLGKFIFADAGRFRKRFHEGRRDLALILAFGAFEPPEGTRGASVVRGYTRHLRDQRLHPPQQRVSLIVSIFVSSEGSSRALAGGQMEVLAPQRPPAHRPRRSLASNGSTPRACRSPVTSSRRFLATPVARIMKGGGQRGPPAKLLTIHLQRVHMDARSIMRQNSTFC